MHFLIQPWCQFQGPWPNPSLNTDVPNAGLRPRIGPPVSLFR